MLAYSWKLELVIIKDVCVETLSMPKTTVKENE